MLVGTTKEVFEAYVEGVLAPFLRPGQVVVMDNNLVLFPKCTTP